MESRKRRELNRDLDVEKQSYVPYDRLQGPTRWTIGAEIG